jgi:hypothetical protein
LLNPLHILIFLIFNALVFYTDKICIPVNNLSGEHAMKQRLSRFARLSTLPGIACCLILLLTFSLVGGASENKISPQKNTPPDKPNEGIKLLIRSQSDSPIVLIAKNSMLPPSKTLYVAFVVRNVSKKSIRAYAIRHDVMAGGLSSDGLNLNTKSSKKLVFLPGQTASEEIGGSEYFPAYIEAIRISVDFVEFEDGTTWGPDTYQSVEGWRAGAKEMRKQLAQMLNTNVGRLQREVENDDFTITPPQNKSVTWLKGYKTGAASIRARVKHALNKGDHQEIEKAIKDPIDASEGGQ